MILNKKKERQIETSESEDGSIIFQESVQSAEEWDENKCASWGENYFKTFRIDDWVKCCIFGC